MSKELQKSVERVSNRCLVDSQFKSRGQILFNDYVTVAPGKTERNSITLMIDPDLSDYHRPTRWQSLFGEYAIIGVIVGILILAFVGLISLISFVMK